MVAKPPQYSQYRCKAKQLSSQAGASSQAAKLVSNLVAREAIWSTIYHLGLLPETTKMDHFATQIPRWQYSTITY